MNQTDVGCACQFCEEFSNPPSAPHRIIWSGGGFVVLPSIGSFTPGYLMLMPRIHTSSFAGLSSTQLSLAWQLGERIRVVLEAKYGPCIIAEHGPGPLGSRSSACCDHAHLHFIPCDPHRVSMEYESVGGSPQLLTEIAELRNWNSVPYMFLSPLRNVYWVWEHAPQFGSQFVRRVCTKILGCPDFYDWALFEFRENMLHTRAAVGDEIKFALGTVLDREWPDDSAFNLGISAS